MKIFTLKAFPLSSKIVQWFFSLLFKKTPSDSKVKYHQPFYTEPAQNKKRRHNYEYI